MNVLLPQPIEPEAAATLAGADCTVTVAPDPRPETVRALIKDAHGLILRTGLTVTADLLDTISSLIDSCIKFLTSPASGPCWIDASITSIAQSTTQPDTVEVGLSVQVPYNLNYIDVDIAV